MKTEKITIEYPSYRKEIEFNVLGEDIETTEYCEAIEGDVCYFKKEKDGIFRIYKRVKNKRVYPTNSE